jgi:hypothetical protein
VRRCTIDATDEEERSGAGVHRDYVESPRRHTARPDAARTVVPSGAHYLRSRPLAIRLRCRRSRGPHQGQRVADRHAPQARPERSLRAMADGGWPIGGPSSTRRGELRRRHSAPAQAPVNLGARAQARSRLHGRGGEPQLIEGEGAVNSTASSTRTQVAHGHRSPSSSTPRRPRARTPDWTRAMR